MYIVHNRSSFKSRELDIKYNTITYDFNIMLSIRRNPSPTPPPKKKLRYTIYIFMYYKKNIFSSLFLELVKIRREVWQIKLNKESIWPYGEMGNKKGNVQYFLEVISNQTCVSVNSKSISHYTIYL